MATVKKAVSKGIFKSCNRNYYDSKTLLRLSGLDTAQPLTICNEEHRFIVAEQLREINELGTIILEPVGRHTSPAIALAALAELNKGNDPVLLVLAADHVIENTDEFQRVVKGSAELAEAGKLVTFGIVPSHAETGYGYIRAGARVEGTKLESGKLETESTKLEAFSVDSFVEKPDLAKAEEYLASGEFYWNSGMFLLKVSRYIEELAKFSPEILTACQASLEHTASDLDFIRVDAGAFTACPDDSIDYAVMEKTESAVVVPLDAAWNDIGSFSAIWDFKDKDENGNVHQGDVLSHSSTNSLVIAEQKLVATVGLDNIIVVETKDSISVANKDIVQDVKKIVEQLKSLGRNEAVTHRQVYRPWVIVTQLILAHVTK
jgi:mannose-1-phosphate guanylyltransferase